MNFSTTIRAGKNNISVIHCPEVRHQSSISQRSIPMININTSGQGLYEFTGEVRKFISQYQVESAIITLFIQHTSASLVIQENADPTVLKDLHAFFKRIAPEGGHYLHDTEGPDDMPAHIKSALTATSLAIPIENNQLALGTWQGVYVFEHRHGAQTRRVHCSITPTL